MNRCLGSGQKTTSTGTLFSSVFSDFALCSMIKNQLASFQTMCVGFSLLYPEPLWSIHYTKTLQWAGTDLRDALLSCHLPRVASLSHAELTRSKYYFQLLTTCGYDGYIMAFLAIVAPQRHDCVATYTASSSLHNNCSARSMQLPT
jgi:hypothetical protein